MESSSQNQNCTASENTETQETFKPEAEESIEQLRSRIKDLRLELASLSSELENRVRKKQTPNQASLAIRLDEGLQKQILMLTEAMPHMVWIADSEGKTTHANSRFHEFSGLSTDNDDGWAWVKVLHPEDLQKAIETGNQAALENKSFSMEVRCRAADGSYKWHLMHSIPFFDPSTNSTKWFGTTTCIDEQIKAQEELTHSEYRFRTLADAIPQIVFVASADGEMKFWNHRWYEYSGFTDDQSLTDAWQLLIHPEDRSVYLKEWQEALKHGDTLEVEFRIKRGMNRKATADNRYLWHLARAVALRDVDEKIECWFGTWTDIDLQKRSTCINC